jgi:hypothetical protein
MSCTGYFYDLLLIIRIRVLLESKVIYNSNIRIIQWSTNMEQNYPFAHEFITDAQGNVIKVVLPVKEYQQLIETLKDEGLLRAMKDTEGESVLTPKDALAQLEENENSINQPS